MRTGRASFVHDALGILAPCDSPAGSQEPGEGQGTGSTGPPEATAKVSPEGTRRHEWHWKDGRWLCVACLATARTPVPPRLGKCPGMASNLARLVQNPRKHRLHIATFADGKGVVVVCSRCGHYATSNRPTQLHKQDCVAVGGQSAFASPGAESAYRRIALGKHPKHAKGEGKVLDPCMSLEALLRTSQEPKGPPP